MALTFPNGSRLIKQSFKPMVGKNSPHLTQRQEHTVETAKNWGVIVDLSDIFRTCTEAQQLHVMLSYMDIQSFIQTLLVSPEYYECTDVYEQVYDIFGGELTSDSLRILTDEIDVIYKQLCNKVTNLIRIKYTNEPYIFHKWIDERTAIIGSSKIVSTNRKIPVRSDYRDLGFDGIPPWEPILQEDLDKMDAIRNRRILGRGTIGTQGTWVVDGRHL